MGKYSYKIQLQHANIPKRVVILLLVFLVLVASGALGVQQWYRINLQPVSSSTTVEYFTVADGATLNQIAKQLQTSGLIRSDQAFIWYVSSRNARDKLQAGTYKFAPNETTSTIADAVIAGKVAADLVTILPGQRLDQIRQAFIKSGFKAAAVDAGLKAAQYRGSYPALADNPPGTSLEGFLYPDTFQKTATTDPSVIIGESLVEMQQHLTPDIRAGFAAHGLTVYQGVTLASIVEREVPSQNDRDQAAQVFLKRLSIDMPLASDATASYGAILDGVAPSLTYDSAYNTYLHKGLPPGPVANVTASALEAVAHPANTDWLYFVSGDDGVTHFASTADEQSANVQKYCHTLCNQSQ